MDYLINLAQQSLTLSSVVFFPLLGAALMYVYSGLVGYTSDDEEHVSLVRAFATGASLITFALAFGLFLVFDQNEPGMQIVENAEWVVSFGINYQLGVDGISILLVLLTTLIFPIACLQSISVKKHVRGYLASLLLLETSVLGALVATDTFLFFVFWEAMLFPIYFLVGCWGGEKCVSATIKFILYTLSGSVLMFIGLLYLVWVQYTQTGQISFALEDLMATKLTVTEQAWLFGAFCAAFAVKIPLIPFHSWLPEAYVEAPTGGSLILAGVLFQMGVYGLLRFAYPLFPIGAEMLAPWIGALAVAGIIYGALIAWAQEDVKRTMAYASISHMGYAVLGVVALNTVATTGTIYQMLNHGISAGALFLLIGMLQERSGSRRLSDFGGLITKMPVFAAYFLVFTLSAIALPLTLGFVGEFMVLAGSFKAHPWLVGLALSGAVLGAIYMLNVYKRMMCGEVNVKCEGLSDLTSRELVMLTPLLVLVFLMGIFPNRFLAVVEPTMGYYMTEIKQRTKQLADFEYAGDVKHFSVQEKV